MKAKPTIVRSAETVIAGVTLRAHLLSDGRRLIDATDMTQFLTKLGKDGGKKLSTKDVDRFIAFLRGMNEGPLA